MFKRKPKIVDGWSVTANPNKFNGDVILGLGSSTRLSKNGNRRDCDFKEQVTIRLNKDDAHKLCKTIMEYFGE